MTLTPAAFAFLLAAAAYAQDKSNTLPKRSPFMPVGNTTVAAAASNETLEFAGVSSFGKRVDLIFHDKVTKKNHWIGIGETKEGITVTDYDARHEQVAVKVNGIEKTLALRKGSGTSQSAQATPPPLPGFNTPISVTGPTSPPVVDAPANAAPTLFPTPPSPVKTDAPPTSETQARQETEARMLVSDLLEIGMAQRRAYEEAQRKSSSVPPSNAPPPPTEPNNP